MFINVTRQREASFTIASGAAGLAEGGDVVYQGEDEDFVAYIDSGSGLVATTHGVFSLSDRVLHPVADLSRTINKILGVRAHDDTFRYAVRRDSGPPELWSVDASGATKKLGAYPPPPPQVTNATPALLAPDDSLYGDGTSVENFQIGMLYRVRLDGDRRPVYSENNNKAGVDVTAIFTGP